MDRAFLLFADDLGISLPARRHLDVAAGRPFADPNTPVLAEIFKAQGYHTAAFVNNGVAGKALTGAGFDEYDQGQPNGQVKDITQRGGEAYNLAPETTRESSALAGSAPLRSPSFCSCCSSNRTRPTIRRPKTTSSRRRLPDETNTGYDLKGGHLFRLAMLGDQKAIERLYDLMTARFIRGPLRGRVDGSV